jgi:hypothetical protein
MVIAASSALGQTSMEYAPILGLQGYGTGVDEAANNGASNISTITVTDTMAFTVADSQDIWGVVVSERRCACTGRKRRHGPGHLRWSSCIRFDSGHAKTLDVTEVFTLTCTTACGNNRIGFLTGSNQFQDAPEPSTFLLLGTALAELAFASRCSVQ